MSNIGPIDGSAGMPYMQSDPYAKDKEQTLLNTLENENQTYQISLNQNDLNGAIGCLEGMQKVIQQMLNVAPNLVNASMRQNLENELSSLNNEIQEAINNPNALPLGFNSYLDQMQKILNSQ
jgi:hypothetical protein